MSSKRPLADGASSASSSSSAPPPKRAYTLLNPIDKVTTLEELDAKVLRFQNKKLAEKIELRRKNEQDLRNRIEQLEKRLTTDDDVLMVVNRYWNQLDEDVRVLLQRFDAEAADEAESKNECAATTSFIAQLSTWDNQEIDEALKQRVNFSKRAIVKLLQAFDHSLQRRERVLTLVQAKATSERASESGGALDKLGSADAAKEQQKEEGTPCVKPKGEMTTNQGLLEEVEALQNENKRLHNLCSELHGKQHATSLQFASLQERIERYETEMAELKNQLEDVEYENVCIKERAYKLESDLGEACEKLRQQTGIVKDERTGASTAGVSKTTYDELHAELEEQKELASNRLTELETLHTQHQEALQQIEQLKMDLKTLPDTVIFETTEYKCLKSEYSVLYNEALQIKTQLEDVRMALQLSKNAHLKQIEQMECDELLCQKKLRTELIQLEDTLAQVRKEYETLRVELEQTVAANEQTGPINREMRNLISSLQGHNQQLKLEINRYKRKFKESQVEVTKLKIESATKHGSPDEAGGLDQKAGQGPSSAKSETEDVLAAMRKEEDDDMVEKEREKGRTDAEILRDMKQQLKKAQDGQKELKLLLDMYKAVPKEQRDKAQLMASEKKAKQEIEELRQCLKKMQENERRDSASGGGNKRRPTADSDEVQRKVKKLEDTVSDLQKEITAQKQEEETLLKEMEVTGQAFEDMQEQNIRLVQQLKEKDDANFKLMAERMKANQIHKLLKEEKDVLVEQINTLHNQLDAQNQVVRKLEEKERILQNTLATVEKDLTLRQQALELHKRKAVETAQTAADLKLHVDKYISQLKEAQEAVANKTSTLEQQSFKYKRIQEDLASVKRKLERNKKIELAGTEDEVLHEEIREYKEQLTCPSCKVKKKDAVLTKCFHVFCLECLKTRYDTRQRKCPKCNAAFGANDYHRIYLT